MTFPDGDLYTSKWKNDVDEKLENSSKKLEKQLKKAEIVLAHEDLLCMVYHNN